jgi:biopolymer transport protein ExbD
MAVGTSSTSTKSAVQSEPNVTPMIDVMLVLLIIFMVVTPALLAGFNATPPQGVNLKDHPEVETDQVLGIDATGVYYLNKRPIRRDDLPQMLKTIYDARTEDKILYVKAHKDIEYSKVVDALDVASRNGVRVVGMISEQKAGTQSTVPGDSRAQASGTKGGAH